MRGPSPQSSPQCCDMEPSVQIQGHRLVDIEKLQRWVTRALKAFGPATVVLAAALAVISAIQALTGNTISANNTLFTSLVLFVFAGTAVILRHEYLLTLYENYLGNDHARRLWAEGIPPVLDTYLRYVGSGDFGMVNRFWLAGISGGADFQGRSDLHLADLPRQITES
jgi:hypothetical protein